MHLTSSGEPQRHPWILEEYWIQCHTLLAQHKRGCLACVYSPTISDAADTSGALSHAWPVYMDEIPDDGGYRKYRRVQTFEELVLSPGAVYEGV